VVCGPRAAPPAITTALSCCPAADSGGRGRPRVTFDVTQGLSAAGVGVFMADVYIERPEVDPYGCPLPGGPVAQEMHRFLIHLPGERLERRPSAGARGP
jgi:hypothetical protein